MTGHIEILFIGGVVLLLFGATAIPRLARPIGKARREFKKGLKDESAPGVQLEGDEPDPKDSTSD